MTKVCRNLVIIGGGPAGYTLAIQARKAGLEVCVIEENHLGGTCLNYGCIPTKSLIHDASFIHHLSTDLEDFVRMNQFEFDYSKMVERKDKIVDDLKQGIIYIFEKLGIELVKSKASFVSNKMLRIENENPYLIEADRIVIASGSKTKRIISNHFPSHRILDSKDLLSMTELPKTLLIVGAGIIGMEFAFIYSKLGVKVTMIELDKKWLSMVDKDVSSRLMKSLKQHKIDIYLESQISFVQEKEDGIESLIQYRDQLITLKTDFILEAVGRGPNIDNLGLDHTDISYTNKGITVDEHYQTNVLGVYAIGDCNGHYQLAHAASSEAHRLLHYLIDSKMDPLPLIPSVIFTDPEIAMVGITEDYAKNQGLEYTVKKVFLASNGKAVIERENLGFIKYILNQDGTEILGAITFGNFSSSIIHQIELWMHTKLSFAEMNKLVFAHPSISEIIHESSLLFTHKSTHMID